MTIHWHGIDQKNTTVMDGVQGITQCGIPPGKSFTYEFRPVNQRGTFWYHAHQSVYYTDGLFGPIVCIRRPHAVGLAPKRESSPLTKLLQVVHDPQEKVPKYDDEKVVFVGDHYHTYATVVSIPWLV